MAEQVGKLPPVRFGVIGINHNHIYGMTDLLLRAGAELVSFYAPEPELAAEYGGKYPQARAAGSAREVLEDETHCADRLRRNPCRSGGCRHRGDAARQGCDQRQAGLHDARTAGRGAARAGGDGTHLLDLLQRTAGGAGGGQGRRTCKGGRDRPGGADRGPRPAPDPPAGAAGLVLQEGTLWRHPDRHRFAPGRPVPVLYRFDGGERGGGAGRQRRASSSIPSWRTLAT